MVRVGFIWLRVALPLLLIACGSSSNPKHGDDTPDTDGDKHKLFGRSPFDGGMRIGELEGDQTVDERDASIASTDAASREDNTDAAAASETDGTSATTDAGIIEACSARLAFRDADHDSFGDPSRTSPYETSPADGSCAPPDGYVEDNTDCYDANTDARPGQMEWFEADRGDGSFDYDCNAQADMESIERSSCSIGQHAGWASTVPKCGQVGSWQPVVIFGCSMDLEDRAQRCH